MKANCSTNRMRKRSYVKIAWKQKIPFFQYNLTIFHNSDFDFWMQKCTKIRSKIAFKMVWRKFGAKTLQDTSKTLARRPKKPSDLPKDSPHFHRDPAHTTAEKTYQCRECSMEFDTCQSLSVHNARCHKVLRKLRDRVRSSTCSICLKAFSILLN